MGINYIWDTNICIYYLQKQFTANAELFMDNIIRDNMPTISAITEIELLCWKTANENDLTLLNNFINDIKVIELEQTIKTKTVALRKNYGVKLPDAIIAATAIQYELTLITNNTKDFKKITELKLVNPFD